MSYNGSAYGTGRRGRGGGRGRGRGGYQPEWFLHDDRDEAADQTFQAGEEAHYETEPGGAITVRVDGRGSRVVRDHVGASSGNLLVSVSGEGQARRRRVLLESGQEGWEYRDKEGAKHGLFPASRILKWMKGGYFSGDLPIRWVGLEGGTPWTTLDRVLHHIQSSAAAERAAAPAPAPPPQHPSGRGRGGYGPPYAPPGAGREGSFFDAPSPAPRRGFGAEDAGGRGRPAGPDPATKAAVQRLFSGDAQQGSEQPMWRYIDPDGNMQGPFPAQNMVDWYMSEYLNSELPVCGTERKVSPPNLPTPAFFVPLGRLVAFVKQGNKFEAVKVEDVRGGTVPESLMKLKAPTVAAPSSKAERPKAAKAAAHKSTAQLAAEVAAAAVRAVLVACGEAPPEPSPPPRSAKRGRGDKGDRALAAELAANAVHAVLVACGERPAVAEGAPPAEQDGPGSALVAAAIASVVSAHDAPAAPAETQQQHDSQHAQQQQQQEQPPTETGVEEQPEQQEENAAQEPPAQGGDAAADAEVGGSSPGAGVEGEADGSGRQLLGGEALSFQGVVEAEGDVCAEDGGGAVAREEEQAFEGVGAAQLESATEGQQEGLQAGGEDRPTEEDEFQDAEEDGETAADSAAEES